MRSPAASVRNEDADAVSTLRGLRGKLQIAEASLRLPDLEWLRRVRNDSGNRRVSVQHRERAAVSDRSQVFAQAGLQIGDSHIAHDYIIVTIGHEPFGSDEVAGCLGHCQDVGGLL
jgi:hypothetical protein